MVTSDLEDRHLREHSRRSSCPRNLLDGKAVPFEVRIPYSVPHPGRNSWIFIVRPGSRNSARTYWTAFSETVFLKTVQGSRGTTLSVAPRMGPEQCPRLRRNLIVVPAAMRELQRAHIHGGPRSARGDTGSARALRNNRISSS